MTRLSDSDLQLNLALSRTGEPISSEASPVDAAIETQPQQIDPDQSQSQTLEPDRTEDQSGHSDPQVPSSSDSQEEPEQGFGAVLKNPNFLMLWGGQVFSQLADKVYLVLIIALITSQFQAPDQTISGWVSSVMVTFTIPAVLFGSVAGVFVDRWPKKQVLVSTNLLRGGLVLALPFLLWTFHSWAPLAGIPIGFYALLGVTFIVSTLTQFFAPAEQSVIPLIVEHRLLLPANSLYTLTTMVSVIIGFAVGEPVLALADALVSQFLGGVETGKELVVGGGYAIAGLVLLSLKTGEKINPAERQSPHIWQNIRDGLDYLKQQKQVRGALIQLTILFSVSAAIAVLVVRMAEVIPEIKASQFGFLLAAGGVGMACGAMIVEKLSQRFSHTQLSLYGSIGTAASLAGLALFHHQLWPSLILLACVGAFAAIVSIPMQTTIQKETPEEIRGKIFGLQNNVVNIALSLPLALAGVAETFLGLRVVFLSLAVIVVTGGLFTWYISDTGLSQTSDIDPSTHP